MADITKYPNPLRLFTLTRDEWLYQFIESYNIPMYIFSAVRDTQLGQLMFAIETVRIKRKRSGEDPGPGLLEGENATMFVPLFSLINEFKKFLETENLTSGFLKRKLLLKKNLNLLLIKSTFEWFSTTPEERLDEIYLSALNVISDGIIDPLVLAIKNIKAPDALELKIKENNKTLFEMFYTIYNPKLGQAIQEKSYKIKEGETTTRIFNIAEDEIEISYSDYHNRVNLIYSFILEFRRFLDSDDYTYHFEFLEPILTLEMLIMLPQPDKQRVTLVKEHISQLAKNSKIPSAFYDLISTSYQTFSQLEGASQKILRRLYKNFEKNMKTYSRMFWNYVINKLGSDNGDAEKLISIIWCHLRAIQGQAQYREQQTGEHSESHRATVRLEHIFWVQGRNYLENQKFNSKIHFWSVYASIANKQVRNEKDSLTLFEDLDALLQSRKILTNKTQRKKLMINNADQYSLLQRVLSYGLESRDTTVYDKLDKYLSFLDKLLKDIQEDEMHEDFSLSQEVKLVNNIRTHMSNTLAKNTA